MRKKKLKNSNWNSSDTSSSDNSNSDIFKSKQLDTSTTDEMFFGQLFAILVQYSKIQSVKNNYEDDKSLVVALFPYFLCEVMS